MHDASGRKRKDFRRKAASPLLDGGSQVSWYSWVCGMAET